jgi:hypothetical protein
MGLRDDLEGKISSPLEQFRLIGRAMEEARFFSRFTYDFAAHGGAIGQIALSNEANVRGGAIVVGAAIIVETTLASAGAATVALSVEAAEDVLDITSHAVLAAGSKFAGNPTMTSPATFVKVQGAAGKPLLMNIAGAALTAGKFDVIVFYA